jgi:hypothetical protein
MRPWQPLAQLADGFAHGCVQRFGIRHHERPEQYDTIGENSFLHGPIFAPEIFLRNTAGDSREIS